MRIKLVSILFVLISIFLVGCSLLSTFKYEYKYFDDNIGQINNDNEEKIYIIENKSEALAFCNNNLSDEFASQISNYNDSFYDNNYLIVIVLKNKASNNNYSLSKSYVENDKLTIEIKENKAKISEDAIYNKAFIIEMNNQEKYSDVNIIIK